MASHDQIAAFVGNRIAFPQTPARFYRPQSVSALVNIGGTQTWFDESATLAEALLQDAEFRALRLGTWLGTPEGEILSRAVMKAIPSVTQPEFQLVVSALKLAAEMQRTQGQERAGLFALSAVLVGATLAYLTWNGNS